VLLRCHSVDNHSVDCPSVKCHSDLCHSNECCSAKVILQKVILLNVILLNVMTLNKEGKCTWLSLSISVPCFDLLSKRKDNMVLIALCSYVE
jgi:hypothetical protein